MGLKRPNPVSLPPHFCFCSCLFEFFPYFQFPPPTFLYHFLPFPLHPPLSRKLASYHFIASCFVARSYEARSGLIREGQCRGDQDGYAKELSGKTWPSGALFRELQAGGAQVT